MASKRNPDKTREDLLQAGFEEIHKSGFRSADVPRILSSAGVTKGALYHHFGSKKGLGYAVVDEVVRDMVLDNWVRPLNEADNPINAMIATLTGAVEDAETAVECGCPLHNLAQEMSPVDAGFRERVEKVQTSWRRGLANNLARGQRQGTVRDDVDAEDTAAFVVASCEGSIGLAKGSQDPRLLETCIRGIVQYLETLRPAALPSP
jgi:TetR/AcrR family transcriptional repressor of nem operon